MQYNEKLKGTDVLHYVPIKQQLGKKTLNFKTLMQSTHHTKSPQRTPHLTTAAELK